MKLNQPSFKNFLFSCIYCFNFAAIWFFHPLRCRFWGQNIHGFKIWEAVLQSRVYPKLRINKHFIWHRITRYQKRTNYSNQSSFCFKYFWEELWLPRGIVRSWWTTFCLEKNYSRLSCNFKLYITIFNFFLALFQKIHLVFANCLETVGRVKISRVHFRTERSTQKQKTLRMLRKVKKSSIIM